MAHGHWLKDYIGPHSGGSGGGSGGDILIVDVTIIKEGQGEIHAMGKTWKEIKDNFPNVLVHYDTEEVESWYECTEISRNKETGMLFVYVGEKQYQTESENGSPVYFYGGSA